MKTDEINEYIDLVFKEKTKEVSSKSMELLNKIEAELLKQVEPQVIEFSKKFNHYLNTTNQIYLASINGCVYLENRIVRKDYEVTDEIYVLYTEYKKLQIEFKTKKQSLFDIFKNLKTEKKILEVYPEFEGVIKIKSKTELQICKDSDIVNYLNS